MSIPCKSFPNANAARGAMNAVKATWVPPPLTFVNCVKPATLALTNAPLTLCSDAYELVDGRWALIADHPGWQNDSIEYEDILRPEEVLLTAVGAESGVNLRPGVPKTPAAKAR